MVFLSLAVAVVLGQALVSFGEPPDDPARAEDTLKQGIDLLASRRVHESLEAFSRYKQKNPQDARPYFYSGIAWTEVGRLSPAASEFQEAVRLGPERPEYRVYQAHVLARLKQNRAASAALAIFGKDEAPKRLTTAWLKLLGDTYFRLERTDDSLRILDLLEERTPQDPDINLNRGRIYVSLAKFDVALGLFRRSIAKSSHNPIAHFEVGKILYERNQAAEAKNALLEAVRQDPTNPQYFQKLGDALLALGEVDEAIEYLIRALPYSSAFPRVYYSLGRAYHRKGNRDKRDEYLKKFQELNSAERRKEDHDRGVERLIAQGEAKLDEGNPEDARALFEQAVKEGPDRWEPHGYLAEMFVSSGNLDRAYVHLVRMEQIDPESVVGNYLTAKYWYLRKEYERARDYAKKVKRSRPGHPELRALLGGIYRELGESDLAVAEFEAAVRLAPDRADFRKQLENLAGRKDEEAEKVRAQ